ncbi:hypothetical protein CBR_g7951 [Chara braunii]|uniref:GYF domain-containing protein n=1 Tax=Chara braunii TaxID=69332 RepID=A0A388KKR8_CHABU|nr:hypothetical protein CBR_g7951 [Chara braunii]|eukprot:GBG70649.1 hypothetical protein CBR_g7951 [Chara braunii]
MVRKTFKQLRDKERKKDAALTEAERALAKRAELDRKGKAGDAAADVASAGRLRGVPTSEYVGFRSMMTNAFSFIQDLTRKKEIFEEEELARKEGLKSTWANWPRRPGPDGKPLPRRVYTKAERALQAIEYMQDFPRFLFGFPNLLDKTKRPYDVQQFYGVRELEQENADFFRRTNEYFYKDRIGVSRGPAHVMHLRTAWALGLIDKNTFVWTHDMDEWAPIGMVIGLEKVIAPWDVKALAWCTRLGHEVGFWNPKRAEERRENRRRFKPDLHNLPDPRTASSLAFLMKEEEASREPPQDALHSYQLWTRGAGGLPGKYRQNQLDTSRPFGQHLPLYLRKKIQKAVPEATLKDFAALDHVYEWENFDEEKYCREPIGEGKNGPEIEEDMFTNIIIDRYRESGIPLE